MLTNRQKYILYFIVDDFLNVGMPISSKHLLEKYSLNVSSATIRNDMAELEYQDYLTKAHTSSGRIPSRKGLRRYINNISEEISNLSSEFDFDIDFNETNLDRLGKGIAHQLSNRTQHLTHVTLKDEREVVKGVYLTPISNTLVLLIIVLDSEAIRQITVEKDGNIDQTDLEILTRDLNMLLVDRPILEVLEVVKKHFQLESFEMRDFINQLIYKIRQLDKESNSLSYYSGLGFLLRDFESEVDTLSKLYSDIENENLPIPKLEKNSIEVRFGEEVDSNYKLLSIVSTNFKHNGVNANLMIIGPEIMGYKEIITLLNAFNQKES